MEEASKGLSTDERERAADAPAQESHGSDESAEEPEATQVENRFPIVGIGASAGGLAALSELLRHVPVDSGVAFVIVVHLSPEHESHFEQLLQPHAKVPVRQVKQVTRLECNHVYVIPPNANLDTIDTHLRLTPLEKRRLERAPIDHFFQTLAETHQSHAVGVILTGTGSDGTLGLRRIKERGGLTVVQDPAEAEYDGMPQSAISGAPVDLVLPLAEIPEAVLRYARTVPRLIVPTDSEELDADGRQFLNKVFAQIRARTGRDFGMYKTSTLLRRISRRMQFNHLEDPAEYIEYMRGRAEEVQALADDLLITVTSFFRDPAVFEVLAMHMIPQLFSTKGSNDVVRAWSVGCATGEEAYSLAILLLEEAARHETPPAIRVFATDLHPASLEKARDAFYPGDIEADVTAERLKKFFQKEKGGYRVRKEVRDLVVFASHNIIADPPFSRIDLISCRNLLIYLKRALQRQVVELFHYSLLPDGLLVLGTSENLDAAEFFRVEDKRRCIYRKRNVPAGEPRLPVFPITRSHFSAHPSRADRAEPVGHGELHQLMVEQYAPPSVLVGPDDSVVHLSAHAGRYLSHPGGVPTTSLFKVVREELRIDLRAALPIARSQRRPIRSKPILVNFDGAPSLVVLDARPSLDPAQEGFVLLIFDERLGQESARARKDETNDTTPESRERAHELEAEKRLVEQRLQAIIEEYETSQEEIKASNEELQSANEELRSTLEELETSKEELQSMNEELQTVNQENRHRVEELGQLSSDLQNLLSATDIATLFLDRELRIQRFTPRIADLFNVLVTDRGRPLTDLTSRIGYDTLERDARKVLEHLVPIERELRDREGRWYLTRLLVYRSTGDRIAGVVITFVEITQQKHAEKALRLAKEYSEHIIETLPEPLLVLTRELRVESANAAFYAHFELTPEKTVGKWIFELDDRRWNTPKLRAVLENMGSTNATFSGVQVEQTFERLGRRVLLINGRRLDHFDRILLGVLDITERFEAERALVEAEKRSHLLALVAHYSQGFLGVIDVNGGWLFMNDGVARLVGLSPDQAKALPVREFFVSDERSLLSEVVLSTTLREGSWSGELRMRNFRDDSSIPVLASTFRVDDPQLGVPVATAVIIQDLTGQRRARAEL